MNVYVVPCLENHSQLTVNLGSARTGLSTEGGPQDGRGEDDIQNGCHTVEMVGL